MADEKTRKRADHQFVNADGEKANPEDATGYVYKDLATDKTFSVDLTAMNDKARTMLALFGAKTLATNTATRADTAGEDIVGAIEARFGQIAQGIWRERGEGSGPRRKYDRDILASVAVEVGKRHKKQLDIDKVREQLNDQPQLAAKLMRNEEISAAYYKAAGGEPAKVGVDDALDAFAS